MSVIKTMLHKPLRVVLPAHRRRALRSGLRAVRLRHAPRAAIVGCGAIAPTHVNGFHRSGAARVVGVSDVSPLALTRAMAWPDVRRYGEHRQMLAELRPELVSVCTWPDSHARIVQDLACAGVRGILCEKPMALRLDHIQSMLTTCRSAGVKLAGGHQFRFHANFIRARELVLSGALGAIRGVRGEISGVLADNGPHLMDAVRFVLGDPQVASVQCACERAASEFYQGLPVEQAASGQVRFDNGVCFSFRTGRQAREYFAIEVQGDKASLTVSPEGIAATPATAIRAARTAEKQFRLSQFRQFADWVCGRQESYPADAEQSARAAEMVIACYESARLGRAVELPLANTGDVIRALFGGAGMAEPSAAAPRPVRALACAGLNGRPLAIQGGRPAVKEWFATGAVVGLPEVVELAKVIIGRNMNCVGGPQNRLLRQEFAAAYGAGDAVTSTSGTAAIHTALAAINPEPGEEVITTPITDMGSVIPILQCNCIPVFADVDPQTGNLTAESIAQRITPRTRAVILVHLFGHPADLEGIASLLARRSIPLIEDCAQAHFAEYHGRKVGTFGDFGCFSLQQSKQIACGDGGVTLVNRPQWLERAELFVDKGWSRQHGRRHLFLGMNYRMTEMQAAVARCQLRRLLGFVQARRLTAGLLNDRLRRVKGILTPPELADRQHAWWMYPFAIDEEALGVGTDEFCAALQFEGVRVNRRYLDVPVFELEVLKEQNTYGRSRFPFSLRADYVPPRLEDYPGLRTFHNRRMVIPWSNQVRVRHARSIAAAVEKVAGYYRAGAGGVRQ